MTTTKDLIAKVSACREARTTRQTLSDTPIELEQAYEVQLTMARQREETGDPIVGYKLGLLSKGKQEQMGVSEPIIGHVHHSMLIDPGQPVDYGRFIQPRVEPELAVVFAQPLPAGARRSDVKAAIDYVLVVADVLDSIYAGYRFTAGDVIADNASWGAAVLGQKPLPPEVLWQAPDERLRLSVDGVSWQEGAVGDLGDGIDWIRWAADKAAGFGRGLQRGDLLLLGSPCPAVALPESGTLIVEGPDGGRVIAPIQ